jgi:hypothetical protein
MQCDDAVRYLDNVVNYLNCQYAFVITRAPLQLFKQQNFLVPSKHLLEAPTLKDGKSSFERTRVRLVRLYYLTTKFTISLA